MNYHDISHLIDYNTAKFFLSLGHLNKDEVLDTPELNIYSQKTGKALFLRQISMN